MKNLLADVKFRIAYALQIVKDFLAKFAKP